VEAWSCGDSEGQSRKEISRCSRRCPAALAKLGDLSEVIGEVVFFDDEKAISVGLNQPQVVEALHKDADPRPGRAHHLGQFFVGNL
jgi:hypothetical protein